MNQGVVEIVFETHSISEDNERGVASGWNDPGLSPLGVTLAADMGRRRASDSLSIVYVSDLRRAMATAQIAFRDVAVEVRAEPRMRECDYGDLNGQPVGEHKAERRWHIDKPYPGGESWRQATRRVGEFLAEAVSRHRGQRILLIGHMATRWGLEHYLRGKTLEDLADEEFEWQEGWEYRVEAPLII